MRRRSSSSKSSVDACDRAFGVLGRSAHPWGGGLGLVRCKVGTSSLGSPPRGHNRGLCRGDRSSGCGSGAHRPHVVEVVHRYLDGGCAAVTGDSGEHSDHAPPTAAPAHQHGGGGARTDTYHHSHNRCPLARGCGFRPTPTTRTPPRRPRGLLGSAAVFQATRSRRRRHHLGLRLDPDRAHGVAGDTTKRTCCGPATGRTPTATTTTG